MAKSVRSWAGRALALIIALLAWYTADLAARAWQVQRFEASLVGLEARRSYDAAELSSIKSLADTGGAWLRPPSARLAADELELRARWWRLLAEHSGEDAERRRALRSARLDLEQAHALRPSWPYAAAALAEVLAAEGAFGSELQSAYRSALARGPNEPRLLRQLLDLALANRSRWPANLQAEPIRIAKRLDAIDGYRLLAIASRRQALDWLCALEGLSIPVHNACKAQGFGRD